MDGKTGREGAQEGYSRGKLRKKKYDNQLINLVCQKRSLRGRSEEELQSLKRRQPRGTVGRGGKKRGAGKGASQNGAVRRRKNEKGTNNFEAVFVSRKDDER